MNGVPLEYIYPETPMWIELVLLAILLVVCVYNLKNRYWTALVFSGFFFVVLTTKQVFWISDWYGYHQHQQQVECYLADKNGWQMPTDCDTIDWQWLKKMEKKNESKL